MKRFSSLLLLLSLAVFAFSAPGMTEAADGTAIKAAPEIVPGTTGPVTVMTKKQLEDYIRGGRTPVLVNFFATWCPPCRAEIPELVKVSKVYGKNVRIIGLSVDDPSTLARVRPFAQKNGASYPIYKADEEIVRLYGVTSIPFNVFYDRDGKVVAAGAGQMTVEDMTGVFNQLSIKPSKPNAPGSKK